MKENLVLTIRKLLKVAADPKATEFEAVMARSRANALMEKHRLNVSLEDYRRKVPGVAGTYWKERLLFAAAKHARCRVLNGPDGVFVLGMLAEDVAAAVSLYERLEPVVTMAAYVAMRAHYTSYPTRDLSDNWGDWDYWDDEPELDGPPPLELYAPLFFRVFMNCALDALIARIVGPPRLKDAPPPPVLPPSAAAAQRMKQESIAKEREALDADAERLANVIGVAETQNIMRTAAGQGMLHASAVQLDAGPKLLPAASSFLPKRDRQSRFSWLEVD